MGLWRDHGGKLSILLIYVYMVSLVGNFTVLYIKTWEKNEKEPPNDASPGFGIRTNQTNAVKSKKQ